MKPNDRWPYLFHNLPSLPLQCCAQTYTMKSNNNENLNGLLTMAPARRCLNDVSCCWPLTNKPKKIKEMFHSLPLSSSTLTMDTRYKCLVCCRSSLDLWYTGLLLTLTMITGLMLIYSPRGCLGAIRPSCRCIIFDDTFGKEYGVFTSPDWPVPYEDNIDCLLYTFIAQSDHIVEITFDEFDVQKSVGSGAASTGSSSSNDDSGCDYGDYVKLFLHLDEPSVDEQTPFNGPLLCGKFPDIEQTHFSSNSTLIFEFHSDWRSGNNTGFRGTFRFLKKAMFRTDGELIDGTVCDYRFEHFESSISQSMVPPLFMSFHQTKSKRSSLREHDHKSSQKSSKHVKINRENMAHDDDDNDFFSFYPKQQHLTFQVPPPPSSSPIPSPQSSYNSQMMEMMSSSSTNSGPNLQPPNSVDQRGYFFSPQYPSTYPKHQHRCSYRFHTNDPNQRIRLLFVEVSLQRNDQSCISNNDVIQVYDGPDDQSDLIQQICGHSSFLEILSSSNELFVEFVSPPKRRLSSSSSKHRSSFHQSSKGFKAEYSFLPVKSLIHGNVFQLSPFTPSFFPPIYGTGSGIGPPWRTIANQTESGSGTGTMTTPACDRWFSSELHPNGTFESPNYPDPYPSNIRCNYHFVGHGKQRVQVIFQHFDVHKVEDQHRDCEISDSLTAYIVTNGQKEWIDDFCGQELPPRIMSNGHRLTLEFKSLDHDAQPYRRFYKKIHYPSQQSSKLMLQDGGQSWIQADQPKMFQDAAIHDPIQLLERHRKWITKSGNVITHSSNEPKIKTKNNEEEEELDEEEDGQRSTTGQTAKKNSKKKKQQKQGTKNQDLTGNEPKTDSLGRPYNRYRSKGFKASFRFVTNFGIETGRQDSKSVCGFVYNSTKTKRGHFTSPNFPGLYPKDTECHYFFYGNATERVRIQFVHFDVEGVTPCTLETASDYVEFSNVYTADRSVYRHCGLKHPKTIMSDGDFFRVTFKSNGRFDGTGFKATYEWQNVPHSDMMTISHDHEQQTDDYDESTVDPKTNNNNVIKTSSVKTTSSHAIWTNERLSLMLLLLILLLLSMNVPI